MSQESTQPTTTAITEIAPLTEAITKTVPLLAQVRDNAVARMRELTVVENEDQAAEVNEVLVASKQASDWVNTKRIAITKPLDNLKESLMVYEKEIAAEDTRLRALLGNYNQQLINEKNRKAAEAKAQREKNDYKVELSTLMKKSLANMVMGCAVQMEEWSKKVFDEATVDTIEAVSDKYLKITPGLKPELYDKCFNLMHTTKITPQEFAALVIEVKTEETYEKWKQLAVDSMVPIINDWRAKIPDIKVSKQALAELEGDEKAELLRQEQEKANQESEQRKQELSDKKDELNAQITQEAEVNKVSNSFVEQASVQGLGSTGPTRKVARFTEDKLVPKALAQIIYHCFMSPKFPGIYKLDRKKNIVMEKLGDTEVQAYAEHVEWWLDFYAKNCDGVVDGIKLQDVAKVIVRS